MNSGTEELGRVVKKLKTGDSIAVINDPLLNTSELPESNRSNNVKLSSSMDKVTDKIFDQKKLFVHVTEDTPMKIDISLFSPHKGLKNCIDPEKVVEMVASTLQSDTTKLTRSKAKHIKAPFVTNTSSQDPPSECAVLLHQDLPEDSTDEEYDPVHDDSSDNESKVSESPVSPYPLTPSMIIDVSQSSMGPEENIGQRTRSKLSLSTTAIETIEQQFIPPDVTKDMYDTECDNQEWLEFLKEFQNPILEKSIEHTEDDNDPEYCIKNDKIENIDFEELRHDKGVKVTKRELHDLMIEWFGCSSPFSSEEESLSTPAGNLNDFSKANLSMVVQKEITTPPSKQNFNLESRDKLKSQNINSLLPGVSINDKTKNKEENNSDNLIPLLRSDKNLLKNKGRYIKEVERGNISLLTSNCDQNSPKGKELMVNDEVIGCKSVLSNSPKNSPRNKNIGNEYQLSTSKNETNFPENEEKLCSEEAIQELDNEIERQLEAKALKNNLSVQTVKSIIKAVVTNQDVVEMVSSSIKGSPHETFLPKVTRSKAKEFRIQANCNHLMPEVKTKSAVLLDDLDEGESSGDEYNPEESSFDETDEGGDNSQMSLSVSSSHPSSPRCLESVKGEGIGQRTRSKVDLQGTSLEIIESNFVPPDVTHDMYDNASDNTDWIEFLKGIHNDDSKVLIQDETDAEFNIMNESMGETDEEEMREDKGVKISKKELRILRDDYFLSYSKSDDGTTVSKDPKLFKRLESESGKDVVKKPEAPEQPTQTMQIIFCIEQLLALQQQLQQHIQLLLQGFLLAYKHPLLEERFALDCKGMLVQLHHLSISSKVYGGGNLQPSLQLISDWEKYLSNGSKYLILLNFYQKEEMESIQAAGRKRVYFPKLPPMLMEACEKSTAFFYPSLLPNHGYRHHPPERNSYSPSESCLIAIALSNFFEHTEQTGNKGSLRQACCYICSFLMPSHTISSVMCHVESMTRKMTVLDNPIRTYLQTGEAPKIMHYVLQLPVPHKRLSDQPRALFPPSWRNYFSKRKKIMK